MPRSSAKLRETISRARAAVCTSINVLCTVLVLCQ